MIRFTINQLIFVYTLCSVIIILAIWIVSSYKEKRPAAGKDSGNIWKCSVCSNDYIDSKHEDISLCPLCGSYNKKS